MPLTLAAVDCEQADGSLMPVLGRSGAMQAEALVPVAIEDLAAPWANATARRVVLQRLLERVSTLRTL